MKRRVKRHEVVQPQDQSIKLIPLTHCHDAIVDTADYGRLSQTTWHAFWNECTRSFYARAGHGGPFMHQVVLGLAHGEFGDHRNHNTLDNRRTNLRKCTRSQNMQNRRIFSNSKSGTAGVSYHKRDQRWTAYINTDGKRKNLGYFDTKEGAVKARTEASEHNHGEFAFSAH